MQANKFKKPTSNQVEEEKELDVGSLRNKGHNFSSEKCKGLIIAGKGRSMKAK